MLLILQTLTLSVGVAARMIIPLIFIGIASLFVWALLGLLTFGLSSYFSTSITIAFITLYGIRMALELKGDRAFPDLRTLATYSVAFGIVLEVLEQIGMFASFRLAILATQQRLNTTVGLHNLASAEETLQTAFTLNTFSFFGLFALVVFVAIQTAFAVPMAAAARSAGKGAKSSTFLEGFGHSFLLLFPIFFVSFFFQVFFKLFAVIAVAIVAILFQLTQMIDALADYAGSEERIGLDLFSGFEPLTILYSIMAILVLLWLQSLVWSGAALALIRHEDNTQIQRDSARDAAMPSSVDLRAMRKARENHAD